MNEVLDTVWYIKLNSLSGVNKKIRSLTKIKGYFRMREAVREMNCQSSP